MELCQVSGMKNFYKYIKILLQTKSFNVQNKRNRNVYQYSYFLNNLWALADYNFLLNIVHVKLKLSTIFDEIKLIAFIKIYIKSSEAKMKLI